MKELEKCLRYGRKGKRLAQSDLARAAGVETSAIINLESGIFVPLDEAALRRIASVADMDETLFVSLYKASFRQELKALRSRSPAPRRTEPETGSAEAFPHELTDIGKIIMTLPAEEKNSLIKTIRMLVRAQAAELQGNNT